MLGLSILFCILCAWILTTQKNLRPEEYFVPITATALALAIAVQGSASIILLWVHLDPTITLFAWPTVLAITLVKKEWRARYTKLLGCLKSEARCALAQARKSTPYLFTVLALIGLMVVSVGPINHPDASDYHAGYPIHFFRVKQLFIDGGLTQGLLGLGDYSHISLIQENQTWLIRSVQSLPLLIIGAQIRRTHERINYYSVAAFATSPVWIQALTIGKPLFLGEACVALTYIYWTKRPGKALLFLLMACIASAITFKVSSALFCLPIAVHAVARHKKRAATLLGEVLRSEIVVLSFVLCAILITERWRATGNPFYPFLTAVFNPENEQMIAFESMLKNYRRDWRSMVELFFPLGLGTIGMSLGPALSLFSFQGIQLLIQRGNWYKEVALVSITQFLLLVAIGQPRADYFLGWSTMIFVAVSLADTRYRLWKLTGMAQFIQLALFSTLMASSLYLGYQYLNDFSGTMRKSAYGFSKSELASTQTDSNSRYTILIRRSTRFYDSQYVHKDLFESCLIERSSENGTSRSSEYAEITLFCSNKLNVKNIYVGKAASGELEGKYFKCTDHNIEVAARNPFNRRSQVISGCTLRQWQ